MLSVALGCSTGPDSGPQSSAINEATSSQDNTQSSTGSFTVSAQVAIQVSPLSLLFSQGELGVPQTQLISISHTGPSGLLKLRNVAFEPSSEDLTITLPEGTDGMITLASGQTKSIKVTWTPRDAEADLATLAFESNAAAPDGGTIDIQVDIQTPSLAADIISSATLVDLRGTHTAATASERITFRNIGNIDAEVTAITLVDTAGDELSVHPLETLPMSLGLGDSLDAEVRYAPLGQDADEATLMLTYTSLDGGGQLSVPVLGDEVSARLEVEPSPIDYGAIPPASTRHQTITLRNLSSEVPLVVEQLLLSSVITEMVTATLPDALDLPLTVPPGEVHTLTLAVRILPGSLLPASPIAYLDVSSNDPDEAGLMRVPIYAQRLGSGLEVHPPDIVYFGYVGEGAVVERVVTLYNAGNEDVTVFDLDLEGDYSFSDASAWGPSQPSAVAATIAPNARHEVPLSFANSGGLETAWGKVVITSDDDAKPSWEVLLNAQKVEGAGCLLQLVPSVTEFGLTAAGSSHEKTVKLVNIGGDSCRFHSAIVDDCDSVASCDVSPDEAMADGDSQTYSIIAQPEQGVVIEPSQFVTLTLGFQAPITGDWIQSFPAMLRARVSHGDEDAITVHPSAASWLTVPNVSAEVGIGQLVVEPESVDFKQVTVGCATDAVSVLATNVGLAPLQITGWSLEGCSEAVEVLEEPTGGQTLTLGIGEQVSWFVRYAPDTDFDEACQMLIESTDRPEATSVTLTAQARYETSILDVFTDSDSQVVDVLFVVDDSGSMSQEQANLAQSFEAFIVEASNWNSDYQIGVTTTTIDIFDLAGGVLQGSPSWVSAMNWEKFVNIVEVGTTGSGTEQGLYAALIALSSPLIDPPAEACTQDSDCGLYRECVLEQCQGMNYGFLRPEAALEVVFVSDEEDQSPDEVENYLDFFRAIKGYERPELLHLHAIVGPPGGCSSANGSAEPGLRYRNIANATGGAVYSICELDFAKGLEGIGEIAFSSQMTYPLSQIPAPPTISVSIEGLPCPATTSGVFNWIYDAQSNEVRLTEEGICKARPGELVEITYELLCFEAVN